MEEALEQGFVQAIDERLRRSSRRSSFSREEFVDTLLDLRIVASDLITLRSFDASSSGPERPRPRSRWRPGASTTSEATGIGP